MRRREYYWSLHHAPRKKQFDDLRTDQVEAVFSILPAEDLPGWQVWREGFHEWKNLSDFPLLVQQLREAPQRTIQAPPVGGENMREFDSTVEGDVALELESTAKSNSGREHARYEGKFNIKIKLNNLTFVSKVMNISLTGIQVADELPESLPKFFPVGLFLRNDMIPILCSVVIPSSSVPSTRLRIESNEYEDVLRTWLIQHGKRD